MIQSMKAVINSSAIGTLEGVRSNMDVMEKKVRGQLSEAEDLLEMTKVMKNEAFT